MKTIYFTATTDLAYDQRLLRICGTLAENGYRVVLVGRQTHTSPELSKEKFDQKRLSCFFNMGKLFYAEFNIRLFFFLLVRKMDAVCAIDLDTILPVFFVSRLKNVPRVYDAHELFTEMVEVINRPGIQKTWLRIERYCVPKFRHGYTVSSSIAQEFEKRYGVSYETIRNLPRLGAAVKNERSGNIVLYQGAVNEGRGLENLIPAMKNIPYQLVICGDGNYMEKLRKLISDTGVNDRVMLTGRLNPDELWNESQKAKIGIAVPERNGLNQYLALPNKFFDYINEGLPQVTVAYPEYAALNKKYEVAVLLDNPTPENIAKAVNQLMTGEALYQKLRENCLRARQELNWENEQKKLLYFYNKIW